MKYKSRREADDDSESKGGWYMWAGVTVLAAMLGVGAVMQFNTVSIDEVSGCPSKGPASVTAVLVDLTDPINGIQEAALRNALANIRDGVPKFGLLEIYPLTQDPTSVIRPMFSGCSPGSGRDVDSSLYGNPELADREWKDRFADDVSRIAEQVKTQVPGENSPLLEGIQSVAVTAFGPAARQASTSKQLIVISDMIHNMAGLNLYKGAQPADRFIGSQYYAKTRASLRGANVDVFLIVRDTQRHVQQPSLYKFWVELFQASDGYLKSWEPLQ